MAKRDINLFKAAGGERAKSTKRSPVSVMLLVGLILIVAALGLAAYFNLKVNTAKTEYEDKMDLNSRYESTINNPDVKAASAELLRVTSDIDAASAIDVYTETRSAFYPEATQTEVRAIRNTIVENPLGEVFSLNEKENEDDYFTPRDYEGLRKSLYEEGAEDFTDKSLFYYALKKVEEKQNEDTDTNVWYAYYRCYFVAVFTGGDGLGIPRLISAFASTSGTMAGQAPFSKFTMPNDVYDDDVYVPAKYHTFVYEQETYNVLLLPMKSVIERAFDILEAHSKALMEDNDYDSQREFVEYGVEQIEFTNQYLSFTLILPEDVLLKDTMAEFDASYFFDVASSVELPGSEIRSGGVAYSITLNFKNRPVIDEVPQE